MTAFGRFLPVARGRKRPKTVSREGQKTAAFVDSIEAWNSSFLVSVRVQMPLRGLRVDAKPRCTGLSG